MSRYLSITTAIAAVFLGAPLAAQTTAQDSVVPTAVTVAAAERLVAPSDSVVLLSLLVPAPASRLLHVRTPTAPMAARAAFGSEGGRNPAMMIVGGAAILVGALVGGKSGSVIMVGGGILGLAGLWNYLK